MTPGCAEVNGRLAALRVRLRQTGARAGQAAAALAAGVPADPALIDELRAVEPALAELRAAALACAAGAGVVASDGLATARDLERLLGTIAQREAERIRQAAWDEARTAALATLERVVSLVHEDGQAFAPLAECQAQARGVAESLAAEPPPDVDGEVQRLASRTQPFADLAILASGWNTLDDERCALLQESTARAFGRPLAFAALRGKLGRAGEPRPAPRATVAVRRAVATPVAPPPPAEEPVVPVPPPRSAAVEAPRPRAEAPVVARQHEPPPTPTPPIPSSSVLPPVMPATPVTPSLAEDLRLTAAAEPPEVRERRRATLERLAKQSAPWWIAARAGWRAMRETAQSVEAMAPRILERFPYLLGVPLQASAGRGVAEGYGLLLEHVERQERGFVDEALLRLNPELVGHGQDERYSLGPELYAYLVAEARLYKTYPEFVKAILTAVLPKPGMWLQGWLVDEADRTVLVVRPDGEAGADAENRRELSSKADRFTTHALSVTLAPLTARVFRLEAPVALDPPSEVDVRIATNDSPSADAWIVTSPVGGGAPATPRRHKVAGTSLALGRDVGTAWIAAFNPDPNTDRRYEVSVSLQRKTFATPLAARAIPATKSAFGKKPR